MTVAEIKEFVNLCIHKTKGAPLEIPKNEVLMILNFIKKVTFYFVILKKSRNFAFANES